MRIDSIPVEQLLRKRETLRRSLYQTPYLLEVRIAILGGSTTTEVADLLELLLLDEGIRPIFYHSEYNKYFEEATIDNSRLVEFAPNIVYVHTSSANIKKFPLLHATEADLGACLSAETARFAEIWDSIDKRIGYNHLLSTTHTLYRR